MICNTQAAQWFLYSLPIPLWINCDDEELHALVRLLPEDEAWINGLLEGCREVADKLMEPESIKMTNWLPMHRQLSRLKFWLRLRLGQVASAAEGKGMDLTPFESYGFDPMSWAADDRARIEATSKRQKPLANAFPTATQEVNSPATT